MIGMDCYVVLAVQAEMQFIQKGHDRSAIVYVK